MEGKKPRLGQTARREADFPWQGLSAALLEEARTGSSQGAPGAGARAAAGPRTGGLSGSTASPQRERLWVGSCRGEAGQGQAGDKACGGRRAAARLVTPWGNSHWSTLLAGHSQTSWSAGSSSHVFKVNCQLEPLGSTLPSTALGGESYHGFWVF